jgi:parallel beta-helix repeat protein
MAESVHHHRWRRPAAMTLAATLAGVALVLAMVAGSAEAATLYCGETITQSVTLSNNLTGCTGDGIEIGADGITLDLASHQISGSGYNGINFQGHSNVTVRNGTVQGFYEDIFIDGNDNLVSNVLVRNFGHDGFFIDGSYGGGNGNVLGADRGDRGTGNGTNAFLEFYGSNNTITGAIANGAGIYLGGGNYAYNNTQGHNTVTNSRISNAGDGIKISGEADDSVTHDTVTGGVYGIVLEVGTNALSSATVDHNNASYNTYNGFFISGAQDSQMSDNTAASAGQQGFVLLNNSGDAFSGNTATGNGQQGFLDAGDNGNMLSGNTATGNGTLQPSDGIYVDSTSSNESLSDNTAKGNTRDGINDLGHSTLSSNLAIFNQGHGIETNGTDGGGNKAHGNQTPPQCIGVICS